MKRFRFVNAFVHAALATVCFQFLSWFLSHPEAAGRLHAVAPALKEYPWVIPLAIAGVLTGLFKYSDRLSHLIIEGIPLLRRLLSGHAFAEGDWPLVVVDVDTGKLRYIGFATIGYAKEQLTIEGRDWTPVSDTPDNQAFRFAQDFEAIQTRVTGNRLQYWYVQEDVKGAISGYTDVYLFPRNARKERLTGRFHDDQHPNVRFYARRIRYGWFARRVKSEPDQIKAARALWADIEPALPSLLRTQLATPWELQAFDRAPAKTV